MKIYIGDITQVKADVIVNAADQDFTPGGGLARWIEKQGGKGIYQEAVQYAPGEIGKPYPTNAGSLLAKKIYHIPTVNWDLDEKMKLPQVHMSVTMAMELAIKEGCKSIAFPLLAAGTVGLEEKEVAEEISDAIVHMENEFPEIEGSLCILSKDTFNKIKDVLPKDIEVIELK